MIRTNKKSIFMTVCYDSDEDTEICENEFWHVLQVEFMRYDKEYKSDYFLVEAIQKEQPKELQPLEE